MKAALALAMSILGFSTNAFADETPPAQEAPPRERVVAVSVNPLAISQFRASANVEIALATHHSVLISPSYGSRVLGVRMGDHSKALRSVGAELGYRFTFGQHSFDGFFLGGSFIAERVLPEPGTGYDVSVLGGALDLGYQTVAAWGFVFGVGAGVQWTAVSDANVQVSSAGLVFSETGLNPRVLLSLGYAF